MDKKKIIIAAVGIAAVAGIIWYVKKNKKTEDPVNVEEQMHAEEKSKFLQSIPQQNRPVFDSTYSWLKTVCDNHPRAADSDIKELRNQMTYILALRNSVDVYPERKDSLLKATEVFMKDVFAAAKELPGEAGKLTESYCGAFLGIVWEQLYENDRRAAIN